MSDTDNPFRPDTEWSVRPSEAPGMCSGSFGSCGSYATTVVQWRTPTMPASAFWYFCDTHAAKYRQASGGVES